MAKIVLTAEYVALGGTDISSYLKKGELSLESDAQDSTTYGSAGWKEFLGGLKSGELSLSYLNDVAAAALDSIMFPLFGTVITFEVRASSAAVGASNPKYTGSILVKEWKPVGGGVGDINAADVSYPTSAAVTRAIA
jgi:hypothetical protein